MYCLRIIWKETHNESISHYDSLSDAKYYMNKFAESFEPHYQSITLTEGGETICRL